MYWINTATAQMTLGTTVNGVTNCMPIFSTIAGSTLINEAPDLFQINSNHQL